MPAPRTKRVPDEHARQVLERLNRSGELPVILGILFDHHDYLRERLDGMLRTVKLTDPDALAAFQMEQGALREVEKIARKFEALGQRLPVIDEQPERLSVRPGRTRHAVRPRGRL